MKATRNRALTQKSVNEIRTGLFERIYVTKNPFFERSYLLGELQDAAENLRMRASLCGKLQGFVPMRVKYTGISVPTKGYRGAMCNRRSCE